MEYVHFEVGYLRRGDHIYRLIPTCGENKHFAAVGEATLNTAESRHGIAATHRKVRIFDDGGCFLVAENVNTGNGRNIENTYTRPDRV